tara:strand:+ start:1010 stop:1195 length:186 start_codon:yes stop_codon:yes gene_type:complete
MNELVQKALQPFITCSNGNSYPEVGSFVYGAEGKSWGKIGDSLIIDLSKTGFFIIKDLFEN